MVGVPGKSKACLTCRKRKILCDLAQPSCQRCLNSRRVCEGYDRYPVFLVRTQDGLQRRKPLEEAKAREIPRAAAQQIAFQAVSVPPDMVPSSEIHAEALFMRVFVLPRKPKHHVRSMTVRLRPLLERAKPGTVLPRTFNAASLTILANRTGSKTAKAEAIKAQNEAVTGQPLWL